MPLAYATCSEHPFRLYTTCADSGDFALCKNSRRAFLKSQAFSWNIFHFFKKNPGSVSTSVSWQTFFRIRRVVN
jgi:hypothetical protein